MHCKRVLLLLLGIIGLLFLCPAGLGEGAAESPYERVIVIGTDGAGTFFRDTDTPEFDRFFGEGLISWNAYAPPPTKTAEGWTSMFYGVSSSVHLLVNERIENVPFRRHALESVFALARKAFPEDDIAAFCNWYAIPFGIIEPDIDIMRSPEHPETRENNVWYDTKKIADDWLDEHPDPRLLLFYMDELDYTGHDDGYNTPIYQAAVRIQDAALGELFRDLEARDLLENALVLLVTDHGGVGYVHGGGSDIETRVVFAAHGNGVLQGSDVQDMELRDVASIILYALGIEQPAYMTGRVPAGLFEGVGGGERPEDPIGSVWAASRAHHTVPPPEDRELPENLQESLVKSWSFEEKTKGLERAKAISEEGYWGSAMDAHRTYLNTGLTWSREWAGFTCALWIRMEDYTGDPVVVANKNWTRGTNLGFAVAVQEGILRVNLGNGKSLNYTVTFILPQDYLEGWMHLTVAIDNTWTVTAYADFQEIGWGQLVPEDIIPRQFYSSRKIFVGQDTTGWFKYTLNALVDEVMIFNRGLTPEEILQLQAYYD